MIGASNKTNAKTNPSFSGRVLSIPGIRTTGAWQKEMNEALEECHLKHTLLDYGFFSLLKFLRKKSRDKEVDRFRDEVTKYMTMEDERPSVIAHSFGSYIVANALFKYKELKLHRLIVCGSIIEQDYSWTTIAKRGQICNVLNEYGTEDIWAKLVAWVVKDAGPSGVKGFIDKADGIVTDIKRPGFRHSDFFYLLHISGVWIPFLQGTDAKELKEVGKSKRPKNVRFLITQTLLLSLVLVLAIFGWQYLFPTEPPGRTDPTPARVLTDTTTGEFPCPFKGQYEKEKDQCVVMSINSKKRVAFHRAEGLLFYKKINNACPHRPTVFASVREAGSSCIIEAPNNIPLYHALNTVYYRPPGTAKSKMSPPIDGVDLYGDDYRDFAVKGEDAENICQNECALDENCKAFSFSRPAMRCWLKYKVPQDRLDASEVTSGEKEEVQSSPR